MPNEVTEQPVAQQPELSYDEFAAQRNSGNTVEPEAVVADSKTAGESEAPTEQTDRERSDNGQFKAKESDVPAGVQKRIDKAVAKQREAERRAEEAERRLAEISARPAAVKAPATTADDEPGPTLDQFDDYDKFIDARTEWRTKQTLKAERQREAELRAAASQQEAGRAAKAAWDESEAETREHRADYQEVMDSVKDIELTPAAHFFIFQSDLKAELAYYLGQNREELERINHLEPHRMAYELGKIEARLDAPQRSVKAERKVTSAPRPPKPVRGSPAASTSYAEDSSYEDFAKQRNAQLHGRR